MIAIKELLTKLANKSGRENGNLIEKRFIIVVPQ